MYGMALPDTDISRLMAEEFFHKFWHPLAAAQARVHTLARSLGTEHFSELRHHLEVMMIMLRRAQTNNWLLTEDGFASIIATPSSHLISYIDKAVEAVSILGDHRDAAKYEVNRAGFAALSGMRVLTDTELFQAALGNILDNARKYSFDRTTVFVTARRDGQDRIIVETANVGIVLDSLDAELCRQRGWRSEVARRHTEKGLGLGLWLTDRILRAINAELRITPTDAAGVTRFAISLPLDSSKAG
jgi:signal transduction histidine kinase